MSDQEFTQFNNKLYAAFIAAHPGEEKQYVEFMEKVQSRATSSYTAWLTEGYARV